MPVLALVLAIHLQTAPTRIVREDLQVVNANGMVIPPAMGLESVIEYGNPAISGDLCLIRSEFDPVIDDLRQGGFEITGLTQRFAGSEPAIFDLRFKGSASRGAVDKATALLGHVQPISEGFNRTGNLPTVNWLMVSNALGLKVDQVGNSEVRRAQTTGFWVTFGGCPCGRSMMLGEIDARTEKLQALIDTLRRNQISVTGIDQVGERFEVQFESEGEAVTLASRLKRAR